MDATTAKLRAESLIRRTEILRERTSYKGLRASPSFVSFDAKPFVPNVHVGYVIGKTLVKSVRHTEDGPHTKIRKIFEKSRADLYKRLTLAFNNDCGCGCDGECQ